MTDTQKKEPEVTMKVSIEFSTSLRILYLIAKDRLNELRKECDANPSNLMAQVRGAALYHALVVVADSMADSIESSLIDKGDSSVALKEEFNKVFNKVFNKMKDGNEPS